MIERTRVFKSPREEAILKDKVRRAKKELREATRELRKLMSESTKGTLDRRKLDSGLKKVRRNVQRVIRRPHCP